MIIGMLIQLAVIGYIYVNDHIDDHSLVQSQRAGCERNKLDRIANAEFQRAHARYIHELTSVQTVEVEVRRAAEEALRTFERTSTSLTERSKINCREAYP